MPPNHPLTPYHMPCGALLCPHCLHPECPTWLPFRGRGGGGWGLYNLPTNQPLWNTPPPTAALLRPRLLYSPVSSPPPPPKSSAVGKLRGTGGLSQNSRWKVSGNGPGRRKTGGKWEANGRKLPANRGISRPRYHSSNSHSPHFPGGSAASLRGSLVKTRSTGSLDRRSAPPPRRLGVRCLRGMAPDPPPPCPQTPPQIRGGPAGVVEHRDGRMDVTAPSDSR